MVAKSQAVSVPILPPQPAEPIAIPPTPTPTTPILTPATPPTTATRAGQEQISSYLASNPDFLEKYVIANVDLETVERWVIRKARNAQKGNGGK